MKEVTKELESQQSKFINEPDITMLESLTEKVETVIYCHYAEK